MASPLGRTLGTSWLVAAVRYELDRQRQQATGNRQQATGNRQQATGRLRAAGHTHAFNFRSPQPAVPVVQSYVVAMSVVRSL